MLPTVVLRFSVGFTLLNETSLFSSKCGFRPHVYVYGTVNVSLSSLPLSKRLSLLSLCSALYETQKTYKVYAQKNALEHLNSGLDQEQFLSTSYVVEILSDYFFIILCGHCYYVPVYLNYEPSVDNSIIAALYLREKTYAQKKKKKISEHMLLRIHFLFYCA